MRASGQGDESDDRHQERQDLFLHLRFLRRSRKNRGPRGVPREFGRYYPVVFSNRFALVKVTFALAAVTLLCYTAHGRFTRQHPDAEALRTEKEHEGKTTILAPNPIRAVGDGSFVVESGGVPVVVRARGEWKPGEMVSVKGVVRDGGIDATEVRRLHGYAWKRGVAYGASLVVAVALLILFLRRTDLRRGVFETRY